MARPVVLIHGAWHGAWCFSKLASLLEAEGFEVSAVDLPLDGTQSDIETARGCIRGHSGAVVLGHSYGGLVMTHASAGLDVSHLVYLCALMPGKDEDIAETIASAPPAALDEAVVVSETGMMSIDPDRARAVFYDDCSDEDVALAIENLRPQRFEPFPVLEDDPPWKHVASTYVICTEDRALHPELQRKFAQRASSVVEIPGAHSPFMSRPAKVCDIIVKLV